MLRGEQRGEVYAPPLLWVKALDMVMDRLVVAGVDFSTVVALSGAAQVSYYQRIGPLLKSVKKLACLFDF